MKRAEKNKKSINEILSAAIKLYSKEGSSNISINELCRDNNISKGKFYHYFSSKEELFEVAVSYVIDDLCRDVESFYVDPDSSLSDNLSHYYSARINYWFLHSDYFMIAYMLLASHNYELRQKFKPLRKKFDNALNSKTLEIIHAANIERNIPDNELLEVLKVVYDNMFLNDMYKIIVALNKGYTEHAKRLSEILLSLYKRLINVLLHGIIANKSES